ncbi:cell signaling regulator [Comamonas phosphati]|nr:cell signaling regulator [Comamonas phosphati]
MNIDRWKPKRPSAQSVNLRSLILALTVCSAFIPFANTFYASYVVQRQQLIDTTLQANYAYATKLANSTEDFLQSALMQLDYAAHVIADHMDDVKRLEEETARLQIQSLSFNSSAILDATGVALATSPMTLQLKGRKLDTEGVRESLATKGPVISRPYLSTAGNFLIVLSQPVFARDGKYLGLVAGTIYLKQESILQKLLGTHFYQDGSYLYVVDRDKHIIYHPDSRRVGDMPARNAAVDEIAAGHAGKAAVTDSLGVEMLAGYAVVPSTGWGIVAQRPQEATLAPLHALMRTVLYKTLPVVVLTLLAIWWSARYIAKPLQLLANGARTMDKPSTDHTIRSVKSWYFESHELKKAMLIGIGLLQKNISKLREDAHTDPLTGLGNRRHLNAIIADLQAEGTPFAVIAIDIDHFKHVNDSHGHDAGDAVLRQLATQIREISRADDIACRVGGEEFLLLLPKAPLHRAAQVAERLRREVEAAELPVVGRVTVSQGVAFWPGGDAGVKTVLKQADAMLYQAKRNGRNRVAVYEAQREAPSVGES